MTGGILRSEIQAGTELGLQVQDKMARGELLDDEIMLQLVGGGACMGLLRDHGLGWSSG